MRKQLMNRNMLNTSIDMTTEAQKIFTTFSREEQAEKFDPAIQATFIQKCRLANGAFTDTINLLQDINNFLDEQEENIKKSEPEETAPRLFVFDTKTHSFVPATKEQYLSVADPNAPIEEMLTIERDDDEMKPL